MFAKSCLCPGLVAMCSNLVCSSDVSEDNRREPRWIKEYLNGKKYEIYMVGSDQTDLSKNLLDKTFSEVAEFIYNNYNVILFALCEADCEKQSKILLNPWDKYLESSKKYKGYIVAEDKSTTNKIKYEIN